MKMKDLEQINKYHKEFIRFKENNETFLSIL